jgi:hypothetical protein
MAMNVQVSEPVGRRLETWMPFPASETTAVVPETVIVPLVYVGVHDPVDVATDGQACDPRSDATFASTVQFKWQ